MVCEPNEVGNGRGTAVSDTAPDPTLISLSPVEERQIIRQLRMVMAGLGEAQGRVMGAVRGSSGHSGFRFVIGEALRTLNLRGSLRGQGGLPGGRQV